MRVARIMIIAGVTAFILYLIWTWDLTAPIVSWEQTPERLGKASRVVLEIGDPGKGLKQVTVAVVQDGRRQELVSEQYAGSGWPWQDRTPLRALALSLDAASMPALREGPFELEVTATDQPNLWLFSRTTESSKSLTLDLTPPSINVISGRHYVRQGGSELVLYRLEEEVRGSGARVGEVEFRGYPLENHPEATHAVLLGLRHDLGPGTSIELWAEDQAGNRSLAGVAHEIIPVRFRNRRLNISDTFIQKIAPEIFSRSSEIERQDSLREDFLQINSRLRELNHQLIHQLTEQSADRLLISKPFLQLSNSQVEAAFADTRSYYYGDEQIDTQTHLGFDLASTAQSPVEAANDGRVLWAEYLGIYGNCVIVDHGWGLLSLYGHLSSIDVEKGQQVEQKQQLGRTGESGLAGGDHLHYSLILQSIQVNPLEWWDPKWIEEHIFARIR